MQQSQELSKTKVNEKNVHKTLLETEDKFNVSMNELEMKSIQLDEIRKEKKNLQDKLNYYKTKHIETKADLEMMQKQILEEKADVSLRSKSIVRLDRSEF